MTGAKSGDKGIRGASLMGVEVEVVVVSKRLSDTRAITRRFDIAEEGEEEEKKEQKTNQRRGNTGVTARMKIATDDDAVEDDACTVVTDIDAQIDC